MNDTTARIGLEVPATLTFVSLLVECHGVIARNAGFGETAIEDMAHCVGDILTLLAEGTGKFSHDAKMSIWVDTSEDFYRVRLDCIKPAQSLNDGQSVSAGDEGGGGGKTLKKGCRRADNLWGRFGPAVTSTMARAFEAFEFTSGKGGEPALVLKRPLPKAK